jgi:isocitrate/isopropylmalate dehydrogenase
MRTYKVATVPGDGIGAEVMHAGLDVLAALPTSRGISA